MAGPRPGTSARPARARRTGSTGRGPRSTPGTVAGPAAACRGRPAGLAGRRGRGGSSRRRDPRGRAGPWPCWPPRACGCGWSRSPTAKGRTRTPIPRSSPRPAPRKRPPRSACSARTASRWSGSGSPTPGLAAREEELAAALREQCAGFGVCLAPWEADAHADHEAAGRAARRAGRWPGRGADLPDLDVALGRGPDDRRRALAPGLPGRLPAGPRPASAPPSTPSPASSPTAGRIPGRCSRPGSWPISPEQKRCCCDDRSPATLGARLLRRHVRRGGRSVGVRRAAGTSGASTRSALAMLPGERYRAGFEPGCSVGVLTRMLAPRCDTLLACDLAAAAVEAAAGADRDLAHVQVEQRDIPPAVAGRRVRPDRAVRGPVLLRRRRP